MTGRGLIRLTGGTGGSADVESGSDELDSEEASVEAEFGNFRFRGFLGLGFAIGSDLIIHMNNI